MYILTGNFTSLVFINSLKAFFRFYLYHFIIPLYPKKGIYYHHAQAGCTTEQTKKISEAMLSESSILRKPSISSPFRQSFAGLGFFVSKIVPLQTQTPYEKQRNLRSFCLLYCNARYVLNFLFMTECSPVIPYEFHCSYGTLVLDHLAADGTGLAGGQIAVVALLEVDADLPWCVFTTKTQFYFEVNTHQGGLMFFDLLKICYPCYIPYRVFCDFSNKAVKDTNTLPVGSSRPSNR